MRISSVTALALASLAIAPTVAAAGGHHEETAEDKVVDDQIREREASPIVQYGIGLRGGSFHVGPVYDFAFGFVLEGGVRIDKLAVLAEYSLMGISAMIQPGSTMAAAGARPADTSAGTTAPPTDPSGFVQRVGLNARYGVAHFLDVSNRVGVRGDLFVEGGLGEQLIRWSGGGYLHRSDVSLGAGIAIRFRGPQHHGGYSIGGRVTLAGPPAGYDPSGGAPTCAGPCDGPTGRIGIDRSVLVMFTVVFGG